MVILRAESERHICAVYSISKKAEGRKRRKIEHDEAMQRGIGLTGSDDASLSTYVSYVVENLHFGEVVVHCSVQVETRGKLAASYSPYALTAYPIYLPSFSPCLPSFSPLFHITIQSYIFWEQGDSFLKANCGNVHCCVPL